ncbi:MAG: ArsC/Spx/MgsR family protein [Pikeienuella sp.]
MTMRLFGLKNCDTCRKALKELEAAGRAVEFVDIRESAAEADFKRWLDAAGAGALINRRSTTWRGLDETARAAAEGPGAPALLAANPALARRPVIENAGAVQVGLDAKTRASVLCDG